MDRRTINDLIILVIGLCLLALIAVYGREMTEFGLFWP